MSLVHGLYELVPQMRQANLVNCILETGRFQLITDEYIGDGLKELRRRFSPLKTGHDLRMAVTREVAPFRLLPWCGVMDHLKTFLHKTGLQAENLDRLALDHPTGSPMIPIRL